MASQLGDDGQLIPVSLDEFDEFCQTVWREIPIPDLEPRDDAEDVDLPLRVIQIWPEPAPSAMQCPSINGTRGT